MTNDRGHCPKCGCPTSADDGSCIGADCGIKQPAEDPSTGCHNCLLQDDFEGSEYQCLHPASEVDGDTVRKAWWADAMPTNCPLLSQPVIVRAKSNKTVEPYREEDDE